MVAVAVDASRGLLVLLVRRRGLEDARGRRWTRLEHVGCALLLWKRLNECCHAESGKAQGRFLAGPGEAISFIEMYDLLGSHSWREQRDR